MKTINDLKKWANIFNNRQYQSEITLKEEDLLKDAGMVLLIGASDDLLEFYGAYNNEIDIDLNIKLKWNKLKKILQEQEDYETEFCPIIEARWDGEMNISLQRVPYCSFNILEGNEKYGNGVIFYWDDFIEAVSFQNKKVRIKNYISKTGRIFNQEWLDKTYKILQLTENNSFKFQDINDSNFILRSSIVEKIIGNNNIIIVETKNTVYELEGIY